MSTTVTVAQISDCVDSDTELCPSITRDREGLLAVLDVIDRAGWDSREAERLLTYVRATVVRPNVAATGLTGPAAEQAEATAWGACWEVLASPSLRSARSPWGVLWATARRAALGEVVAGAYGMDARSGWRLARLGTDHEVSGPVPVDTPTAGRYDPPVSLTDVDGRAVEPTSDSGQTGPSSGLVLSDVVHALVNVGWSERPARVIVEAVAAGATRKSCTVSGARGWRRLAQALDMPPWQVRRVMVVMLGTPGWPGLVERLVTDGKEILDESDMRAALRSTVVAWWPSPVTAARRAQTSTFVPLERAA
ncbi:MAG: hypothetical protein MUF33_00960 [Candidatus Nanopelagicales bacterium]|jgi:hypothetical protein|nr:hypothetical protein [Candidatus Nanopelagicales bacterium]MCU0294588.1 hypothetical protein [Candidatus Nanopelagicales bacterium]MCU0297068.1 hypothetical protein [Candidatus Nanopelagicales bacterium]